MNSLTSNHSSSLNRNINQLSSSSGNNTIDNPLYLKSSIIENRIIQENVESPNMYISNPFSSGCDSLNNRNIIPNAQTILQETLQTDTANLIYSLEGGQLPKTGMKKSQSEFLEQKLSQMKQKHKNLQQQLSEASKIESVTTRKKNIEHSQSTQGFFKGGQTTNTGVSLGAFNFSNLSSQVKQMDVISNILSNIQVRPNMNQQKDIEVIIEKNDLYKIMRILIDQLVASIQKLNEVVSERDIIQIKNENLEKEIHQVKERMRLYEDELRITKEALTESKVEHERLKALYDILERKYIDLLKKKQEVKIINKETIKEVVVERPIEVIKQVNNLKIVKQKKEVRKIIRPQPETKHTIERKLHILEKETMRPEIQVIEKVREIPKIEFIDKEKTIEKPFFIEKLVDRLVEVPKFIPKEVFIDRPVFVDRPVEKIVKVPQIVEKERLVDRPVFIEKPVDRIIEKETFVDRPVYIQEPPVHIERVVEVPKIIQKEKIVDRPVFVQQPPVEKIVEVPKIIEKNNYIDRPIYINKGYEPVQSHLINSYHSPVASTQFSSPAANYQRLLPESANNQYQNRFSPFNSIQTYQSNLLSPQYSQCIPQQIS